MMVVETYELEIADVPPSVNAARGVHWAVSAREKKRWQGMFFIALLEAKVPKPLASVHATARLRFPRRRRRDEGNYRAGLEKALGDALQLQWISDDTPEFFTFGEVTFEKCGPARTIVTLEVEHHNENDPASLPAAAKGAVLGSKREEER